MSGKLSCNAEKCVNNINNMCVANNIHVMGVKSSTSTETECENFSQKGLVNTMSNFTNMNLVGEFKQLFNKDSVEMSPEIKCEAENCTYNVNKLCSADSVRIYGPGAKNTESTQCETFKEH